MLFGVVYRLIRSKLLNYSKLLYYTYGVVSLKIVSQGDSISEFDDRAVGLPIGNIYRVQFSDVFDFSPFIG